MAKKIFFFSLSLFVLVLIFLGAYNLAFKNNVNDPVADPGKKSFEKNNTEPQFTPNGTAENPINEAILGATGSDDYFIYYYSLDDKSIKKATFEGKNKSILMSHLPGEVTRILWSPKRDKALLFIAQDGPSLWYFANLTTKTLIPLKPEISRLAWDNFGEKIFYQYTDPITKKRSLNMANPDGGNWKKLTDLGDDDYYLSSVPGSSLVSFWPKPRIQSLSSLETVGAAGETRHIITSGIYGCDYLWTSNGERVVVSGDETTDGKNFSLRVIENTGQAKDLAIPPITSKTVWSKDNHTLYYALPGGLPENTRLPNDYFEKNIHSKDTFWKIDTNTGKKTRLVTLKDATQIFDSSNLFLSPEEDGLFFTDRTTNKIYRISL